MRLSEYSTGSNAERCRARLYSGVDRLLTSFEVVIIGGLGSFWGAFTGGMALGVAQLIGAKLAPDSGQLYPHLLFFAVLILWPTGLAGRRK